MIAVTAASSFPHKLTCFGDVEHPQLCMYHSDTNTWSKKPLVIESYLEEHLTNKTLIIEGAKGTVTWVDLWHSIIYYDVLAYHSKLRCLRLSPPIKLGSGVGFDDPRSVRDIALVGNSIKYVEMLVRPNNSSSKKPLPLLGGRHMEHQDM